MSSHCSLCNFMDSEAQLDTDFSLALSTCSLDYIRFLRLLLFAYDLRLFVLVQKVGW